MFKEMPELDKFWKITHADKKEEWKTERQTLKHEEGQILVIDFWASWCPPCLKPLNHNEDVISRHQKDWKDVRFCALSIDHDIERAKKLIKERDWNDLEFFHVRNGVSKADEMYAAHLGVPHSLIVDKTGKIVFYGHPQHRDEIEQDIILLRGGGKISGNGTDKEVVKAKKHTERAAIDLFVKETKEMIDKPETIEKSVELMRAFLAMTVDEIHNLKDGTIKNEVQVSTILMGPKVNIDECKILCEEHSQIATFENLDQIEAL